MKFIKQIIFILILSPFLYSCQKAPINGDLDGQWEVVDVIPAPEHIIIQERLYYNFYLHTCMLSYNGGTTAYAKMAYNGETMTLDFIELTPEGNFEWAQQYGIVTNPISFDVSFQDSHHLILSNNDVTVVLVKH